MLCWLPAAQNYGEGRGKGVALYNEFDKSAIPRFAFHLFFKQQAHRVPRGSACLGWDNLKVPCVYFTVRPPFCTLRAALCVLPCACCTVLQVVTKALGSRCAISRSAAFQHQDANGKPAEVGSDGVLRGDLGKLSRNGALAESVVGRFDVIVCQEVRSKAGVEYLLPRSHLSSLSAHRTASPRQAH